MKLEFGIEAKYRPPTTHLPTTYDPVSAKLPRPLGRTYALERADAPGFSSPIDVTGGEVVERDGFVFADLRRGAADF
jgi:hypothetical protein